MIIANSIFSVREFVEARWKKLALNFSEGVGSG